MTITTNPLDALLAIRNGYISSRWNFPDAVGSSVSAPAGIGNPVSLTYSFLAAAPAYTSASGDGASFQAFSTAQQQATRQVLASIEAVARVDFTEVAGVGQLTFANSSQSLGQAGYAYYPSYQYFYTGSTITSANELDTSGDVWINRNTSWSSTSWTPGGSGFGTLLHEVGHALGLKHPFQGNYILDSTYDDTSFTVMSYTDPPNNAIVTVSGTSTSYTWRTTYVEPRTPMALDVVALQYLYGANTSHRTGNDTYSWSTNEEFFETIWDAGGIDTIDTSNQMFASWIDLDDYAYSSIAMRRTYAELHRGLDLPSWFNETLPAEVYDGIGNLAIASGTIIENAIGGNGDDHLGGNAVANRLTGGGGSDTLLGLAGNDTLTGGTGADRMEGGAGNDAFHVDSGADVVVEAAARGTDTVYSYLATLTLGANIENGSILAAGSANLTGNGLDNLIEAGSGNNALAGGSGNDTLSYATATAAVVVNLALARAQATGGSGSDTLSGFENLVGSAYNDRLTGTTAVNTLTGGAGKDTLSGAAGNDRLVGGAGADRLTGGRGGDFFEFNAASESGPGAAAQDVILDFTRGVDRIDLESIDALAAVAGNQAFSFIGSAAFSGNASGQLRYVYDAGGGFGVLQGSTDADRSAEFAVRLTGVTTLTAADILA